MQPPPWKVARRASHPLPPSIAELFRAQDLSAASPNDIGPAPLSAALSSDGCLADLAAVAAHFGLVAGSCSFFAFRAGSAVPREVLNGAFTAGGRYVVCGEAAAGHGAHAGAAAGGASPEAAALFCAGTVFGSAEAMLRHAPPNPRVPEAPWRLARSLDALRASAVLRRFAACRSAGLLPHGDTAAAPSSLALPTAVSDPPAAALFSLPVRHATPAEVFAVHPASCFEPFVVDGSPHRVATPPGLPTDVYMAPAGDDSSRDAALTAAGICAEAVAAVLGGRATRAFAVVRPPGHHCGLEGPSGFCLLNNAAIAGAKAAALLAGNHARVAIVDIDVHHGDGTQAAVESDPRFCFLSLHRYDAGTFFPKTGHAAAVGSSGQCVNVPCDTAPACAAEGGVRTISDAVFDRFLAGVVAPVLAAFRPRLVLLSCGFDAAAGDPLGGMGVVNGYRRFASQLVDCVDRLAPLEPADGGTAPLRAGLVVVLEGGYHPEMLARGVAGVAECLAWQRPLGRQPPALPPPQWEALLAQPSDAGAADGAVVEAQPPLPARVAALQQRHEAWIDATLANVVQAQTERGGRFAAVLRDHLATVVAPI